MSVITGILNIVNKLHERVFDGRMFSLVKRALLVFLAVLTIITAPACWNLRDPELLAIVLATAFDYDTERELYLVIVQIANPQAMQMEQGGSGDEQSFWVISAYGITPFGAMQNLATSSSRELFWAHNRVVLFSEKMARHGLRDVMDTIERERQMRVTGRPAVVLGDIRKLMEAEFPLEETGAIGLDRGMLTIQFDQSVFPTMFLNEVYCTFEAPGAEVILGKIEVQADSREHPEGDDGGDSGSSHPPAPAVMGGAALFKGERLAGWATQDQAKGWLLAAGRGQRFSFVLQCPEEPKNYLSVEVIETGARMIPLVENGEPRVVLEVSGMARFQSFPCRGNLEADSELVTSLERRLSEAIRNRINDMIERAQELETDVMQFGNLFYRKQPEYWKKNGERWDEIFPELAVDVRVNVEITRSGMVQNPMTVR